MLLIQIDPLFINKKQKNKKRRKNNFKSPGIVGVSPSINV